MNTFPSIFDKFSGGVNCPLIIVGWNFIYIELTIEIRQRSIQLISLSCVVIDRYDRTVIHD